MGSRRTEKIAEAIRKIVSSAITSELRDPRVGMVTVTQVEVAGDLRQAKVHVSIMGDDTKQRLGLQGLRSAAGFLQSKIANGIDLRYTPKLEFVLDQGVKKSLEIARILAEVLPPTPPVEKAQVDDSADSDDEYEDDDDYEEGDETDGDDTEGDEANNLGAPAAGDDPDATGEFQQVPSPDDMNPTTGDANRPI